MLCYAIAHKYVQKSFEVEGDKEKISLSSSSQLDHCILAA
jgi:hypothetical protein